MTFVKSRKAATANPGAVRLWLRAAALGLVFTMALASRTSAWYTEAHQRITRAAVESLPAAMQEKLQSERDALIQTYCMFPDRYRELARRGPKSRNNPGPDNLAVMKVYCETPDGKVIHNVTWDREQDLASIRYLLNGIIAELRRGNAASAAQYMGTLAHLLEDSASLAHSTDLRLIQELLPPPPKPAYANRVDSAGQKLGLHAAIEFTTIPFSLERPPKAVGTDVSQAAIALLNRCYAIIRENRAHLLEMVRATYVDDLPTMERLRARAAGLSGELLSDAYYTAFVLAGEPNATARVTQ